MQGDVVFWVQSGLKLPGFRGAFALNCNWFEHYLWNQSRD